MELIIPRGDKGFCLNFTITNADGKAFNLDGYTVTLKVWQAGKPVIPVFEGDCDIVEPANEGKCEYTVAEGDFAIQKRYRAELELTKEDVIESTKYFVIQVTESP